MKIEEIKYSNLMRLCGKFNAETKELMRILGASKQHVSQLLSGKSSLGAGTIEKLCAAWNIEEDEFVYLSESIVDKLKQNPYKEKNHDVHDRVEKILNSDNEPIKAAFHAGLKGVMLSMGEYEEHILMTKTIYEKLILKREGKNAANLLLNQRPRKKAEM